MGCEVALEPQAGGRRNLTRPFFSTCIWRISTVGLYMRRRSTPSTLVVFFVPAVPNNLFHLTVANGQLGQLSSSTHPLSRLLSKGHGADRQTDRWMDG